MLAVAALLSAALAAGCARPGGATVTDAGDDGTEPSTASTAIQGELATCAKPQPPPQRAPQTGSQAAPAATLSAAVSRPPTGTRAPLPGSEQERGEQFERNRAANKAYRNRRPLAASVLASNQPCVDAVRTGLSLLRAQGRYDAASIQRVLTDAGLSNAGARPRGRLDLAGSGGLLFSGWTGQACVFGEHGPATTTVELGSMIADGGCLPSPD